MAGSPEDILRFSSKKALIPASGDETVGSSKRSDIQDELDIELSSKSEDQNSEHLLELYREKGFDSQEMILISKHISSSTSEEHHSSTANLQHDNEMNTNKPHSAGGNADKNLTPINTPPQSSIPSSENSFKEKVHVQDIRLSSPLQDYHDDFESSDHSLPREKHHGSKPSAVPVDTEDLRKDSQSKATTHDGQLEEVEEEIAEELSYHSGTSRTSQLSGRLLDLHSKTEDSNVFVNSAHTPPSHLLQTPLPSVKDEMSDFNIGDRVLVGGVQPGTLKFKGPTSFANGFWAGVELDKSEGSNNGTYDGVVYFACNERHGIFAPPDKIKHLPNRFEMYTDATDDEDSFFDDLPDKDTVKHEKDETKSHEERHLKSSEQSFLKIYGSGDNIATDQSTHKPGSHINSQYNKESKNLISNGNTEDIILICDDGPNNLFSDMYKIDQGKGDLRKITSLDKKEVLDSKYCLTPVDLGEDGTEAEKLKEKDLLDTFADKLIKNFVKETVTQFSEIKKEKEQKIEAANRLNGDLTTDNEDVEKQEGFSLVEQKDGLPFFIPAEQELSSPELCNRPVSAFLNHLLKRQYW